MCPDPVNISAGFPPIARPDARILILGSLPGERSIREQQYYAHPQNAFWRIMREVFGIDGDYAERCRQLNDCGIAVWDVLRSSVRPGSMDADIRIASATSNDFAAFLDVHSNIRLIACNGRKAEQLFARFVTKQGIATELPCIGLPSTSPAYAALSFMAKLTAWRDALLEQ